MVIRYLVLWVAVRDLFVQTKNEESFIVAAWRALSYQYETAYLRPLRLKITHRLKTPTIDTHDD